MHHVVGGGQAGVYPDALRPVCTQGLARQGRGVLEGQDWGVSIMATIDYVSVSLLSLLFSF